jgi:hypothetical protein
MDGQLGLPAHRERHIAIPTRVPLDEAGEDVRVVAAAAGDCHSVVAVGALALALVGCVRLYTLHVCAPLHLTRVSVRPVDGLQTLYSWGLNTCGQLGIGHSSHIPRGRHHEVAAGCVGHLCVCVCVCVCVYTRIASTHHKQNKGG